MKKYFLLVILFWCFSKNYGQEPIQEAYVSKAHVMLDEEWTEVNYGSMINVSSNRQGYLKIANAEFLTELSAGKAKMVDKSAYSIAELSAPRLTRTKTGKNGLVNMTYEGKFIFKTIEGKYTPTVNITFVINQADVIGLKIHNNDNNKDYALDLTIKD